MADEKYRVCRMTEHLYHWIEKGEIERVRRRVHPQCIFIWEINGGLYFGRKRMESCLSEAVKKEKALFRPVSCEEWNIAEVYCPTTNLCFYIIWDLKNEKVMAMIQIQNRKRLESWILVRDVEGTNQRICETGIYCLEACGNHTKIYFRDSQTEARERFDSLCGRLSVTSFLKVHRSYMVNLYYLKRITRYVIELYNGLSVPVPAKKYKLILERVHSFTADWMHNT